MVMSIVKRHVCSNVNMKGGENETSVVTIEKPPRRCHDFNGKNSIIVCLLGDDGGNHFIEKKPY